MVDLLYESDLTRVLYAPSGADTLVVTFSEFGFALKGERFWGDAFARRLGVDAIGFASNFPHWFPSADTSRGVSRVIETLAAHPYRQIITYGHSMGGYAALRFGAALNADIALGSCPQFSIDPAVTGPSDLRYAEFFNPELHHEFEIQPKHLAKSNFVLYDPLHEPDRMQVERILALGAVRPILAPFTGHSSIELLTQTGRSIDFIFSVIKAAAGATAPGRAIIREARYDSPLYWSTLAQACATRTRLGFDAMLTVLERASVLYPDSLPIQIAYVDALRRLGLRHDARKRVRAIDPEAIADPELLTRFVRSAEGLGLEPITAQAVESWLGRSPSAVGLYLDLLDALGADLSPSLARVLLERAAEAASPRRSDWVALATRLIAWDGSLPLAERCLRRADELPRWGERDSSTGRP